MTEKFFKEKSLYGLDQIGAIKKRRLNFIWKIFAMLLFAVFTAYPHMAIAAPPAMPKKPPLRLAILPLQNAAELYEGGRYYVERELARLAHVPLNGTLKAVEYIDAGEAVAALNRLALSGEYLRGKKKNRLDYPAMMKPLAEELKADLVLFFRVDYAYERIFYDRLGRHIIDAGVRLELCGWDRCGRPSAPKKGKAAEEKKPKTPTDNLPLPGELIKETVWRSVFEEYRSANDLDSLTAEAIDFLLQKTNVRERIFPTRHKI